jgi:hypothetical protein
MQVPLVLGSPASWPALEDVAVVEEAVEHGSDGGGVAEELAPVLDWTVRGDPPRMLHLQ